MQEDEWEYPLWVLLGAHVPGSPYRLEHVNVTNLSSNKADPAFRPCGVVYLGDPSATESSESQLTVGGIDREQTCATSFDSCDQLAFVCGEC